MRIKEGLHIDCSLQGFIAYKSKAGITCKPTAENHQKEALIFSPLYSCIVLVIHGWQVHGCYTYSLYKRRNKHTRFLRLCLDLDCQKPMAAFQIEPSTLHLIIRKELDYMLRSNEQPLSLHFVTAITETQKWISICVRQVPTGGPGSTKLNENK